MKEIGKSSQLTVAILALSALMYAKTAQAGGSVISFEDAIDFQRTMLKVARRMSRGLEDNMWKSLVEKVKNKKRVDEILKKISAVDSGVMGSYISLTPNGGLKSERADSSTINAYDLRKPDTKYMSWGETDGDVMYRIYAPNFPFKADDSNSVGFKDLEAMSDALGCTEELRQVIQESIKKNNCKKGETKCIKEQYERYYIKMLAIVNMGLRFDRFDANGRAIYYLKNSEDFSNARALCMVKENTGFVKYTDHMGNTFKKPSSKTISAIGPVSIPLIPNGKNVKVNIEVKR